MKKNVKQFIASIYARLVSKKSIVCILNYLLTLYNRKVSDFFYNSGSVYAYGKEIFPASSLEGDMPYTEFEGVMFPIPKNSSRVLELLYGDYMQLPPEDKRYNRHGVVEIDLGE